MGNTKDEMRQARSRVEEPYYEAVDTFPLGTKYGRVKEGPDGARRQSVQNVGNLTLADLENGYRPFYDNNGDIIGDIQERGQRIPLWVFPAREAQQGMKGGTRLGSQEESLLNTRVADIPERLRRAYQNLPEEVKGGLRGGYYGGIAGGITGGPQGAILGAAGLGAAGYTNPNLINEAENTVNKAMHTTGKFDQQRGQQIIDTAGNVYDAIGRFLGNIYNGGR